MQSFEKRKSSLGSLARLSTYLCKEVTKSWLCFSNLCITTHIPFTPRQRLETGSPPQSQVHPEVQVFGYDLTYHTWSPVTAWTSPNTTLFLHPTFFIYSNTAKRIKFKKWGAFGRQLLPNFLGPLL